MYFKRMEDSGSHSEQSEQTAELLGQESAGRFWDVSKEKQLSVNARGNSLFLDADIKVMISPTTIKHHQIKPDRYNWNSHCVHCFLFERAPDQQKSHSLCHLLESLFVPLDDFPQKSFQFIQLQPATNCRDGNHFVSA